MPGVYQLQNWHFSCYKRGEQELWNVHGQVYGHEKFPDGTQIHTSSVQSIHIGLEALEVQTRNSVYQCPYSSCKDATGGFLEVERLFPEPAGEEETRALVAAIYRQKWDQFGPPIR